MVTRSEMEAQIQNMKDTMKSKLEYFEQMVASFRERQENAKSTQEKQEKALERIEKEINRRTEKLDKREEALQKREKEANELLLSLSIERGEQALAKLEDEFQCSAWT